MRIISGDARGRKLFAPSGEDTRPTADRIRESLFNILSNRVWDAEVLDLFGGTGAMALEALSRGAAHAVIVDSDREAIRAIRRNAEGVLKDALNERAKIIRADYRAAIDAMPEVRFDLVFLDPPYRMTNAYADALTRLRGRGLLNADCICLLERAADARILLPDGFECTDVRTYGGTSVEFVREAR